MQDAYTRIDACSLRPGERSIEQVAAHRPPCRVSNTGRVPTTYSFARQSFTKIRSSFGFRLEKFPYHIGQMKGISRQPLEN